jgi:hypothetical protein
MYNANANHIELRQQRDFSALIGTGFEFVRQNWKTLYRPLVFICLPVYIGASLLFGNFFRTVLAGQAAGNLGAGMGSMLVGYVAMALAGLLINIMVYEYMRGYMLNQGLAPGTGELLRKVRGQFFSYLALGLLAGAITVTGMVFFVLPGIWLAIVFSVAFPLLAFERASVGDCVGRSFKLVKGHWWHSFGLVLVLAMLIGFLGYVIYLPFMLFMGFGTLSGMADPSTAGSDLGWMMTLFMLVAGAVNVLLQPLLLVPLGLNALSLMEEKEGRGLLQRVEEMPGPGTPA